MSNSKIFAMSSPEETSLAKVAHATLAQLLCENNSLSTIEVSAFGESFEVPVLALDMLVTGLDLLSAGNSVMVESLDEELTTQEAADYLNVSRPFLIQLLENGEIPYSKVRRHRRIKLVHLIDYKGSAQISSSQSLEELEESLKK